MKETGTIFVLTRDEFPQFLDVVKLTSEMRCYGFTSSPKEALIFSCYDEAKAVIEFLSSVIDYDLEVLLEIVSYPSEEAFFATEVAQ